MDPRTPATTEAASAELLVARHGAAGVLTLNRPRALNALSSGMIDDMNRALQAWAVDPAIACVILKAAPESRAFCAGGDIRWLHSVLTGGHRDQAMAFWRDEYRLDALIHRYPKPFVSLIDGIVMGGGAGISINGRYRIAGDGFSFAMPEVGIGFFPDAGATYFLSRLPDAAGAWCALTGGRVGPDDATRLGIATHRVASHQFEALGAALMAGEPVEAALARFAVAPAAGALDPVRRVMAEAFGQAGIGDIAAALDVLARGSGPEADFARQAAEAMAAKSPLSLAIAREQMRRGAELDFEASMVTEFRIVSRLIAAGDFTEGVRAVVIDKDNKPVWPSARAGNIPDQVAACFAPLPDDLTFI